MAKKISIEEFKGKVAQYLKDNYMPEEDEEHLMEIVNDKYFAPDVEDGYNNRFGIEYGVYYVAHTIDMCV